MCSPGSRVAVRATASALIGFDFPGLRAQARFLAMRRGGCSDDGVPSVGDIIVGDADGVVAVPAQLVQSTLELAAQRAATDERTRNAILDGRTPVDALGLNERIRALGYVS